MRSRSHSAISPELCIFVGPQIRGRRESRAPDAPVDPARRGARASRVPKHTGKDYRYSQDIPASPAQWSYGLYVLSPGNGLCCPRCRTRTGGPDRRQGRGARTTRFRRTLPRFAWLAEANLTPQASIATRTTLRDDRETSLMAARADGLIPQIRIPVKRN